MSTASPEKTTKITDTDQKVLDVVRQQMGEGISPTNIGLKLGYAHAAASSRVAPSLSRLVAKTLVRRIKGAGNKVTYVSP